MTYAAARGGHGAASRARSQLDMSIAQTNAISSDSGGG